MKFLFIYPDIDMFRLKIDYKTGGGQYHPSIASLSACLKKAGVETKLLHICMPITRDELIAKVRAAAPDMIGFSATTFMFGYARTWAEWLKPLGIYTICGGVHATLNPKDTIRTGLFDAICVGEAEEAIVDLVSRFSSGSAGLERCPNFWFRRPDGTIVENPTRPLVTDLDRFPMEDLELFDYHNFETSKNRNAPFAIWASSRGCPFVCAYCSNETLKRTYPNKTQWGIRFRSPEYSIAHLKMFIEKMPYLRYFNFLDSNINLNMEWYRAFMTLYKKEIPIPFRMRTLPSLASEETVRLARDAGCIRISYGIEAGNEEYRKRVLKRQVSERQMLDAFNLCRKYRIETSSFNMVGLPEETFPNMLETAKINARAKVDIPTVTIFYPFPNTPLYDLCVNKGYSIEYGKDVYNMAVDSILDQKSVTYDQVMFVHRCFRELAVLYRLAYALPGLVGRMAEKVFDRIFSSRLFPYRFVYRLHDAYFNQIYLSYLYRRSERPLSSDKKGRKGNP